MQISYQETRENESDITVFWTLIDDEANSYEWHSDIPKEVDIQSYLDSQMQAYLLMICKREYPGAQYQSSPGKTELDRFKEWVADGCMNRDDEGQYEEKIEKVPWQGTHPKSVQLKEDIDAIASIDDVKTVLSALIA